MTTPEKKEKPQQPVPGKQGEWRQGEGEDEGDTEEQKRRQEEEGPVTPGRNPSEKIAPGE